MGLIGRAVLPGPDEYTGDPGRLPTRRVLEGGDERARIEFESGWSPAIAIPLHGKQSCAVEQEPHRMIEPRPGIRGGQARVHC